MLENKVFTDKKNLIALDNDWISQKMREKISESPKGKKTKPAMTNLAYHLFSIQILHLLLVVATFNLNID